MSKIIIAGAGAAGLCCAVFCARNGHEVIIIEKTDNIGKKLSITGNGRCNMTNLDMRPEYYNSAVRKRMEGFLNVFSPEKAINFFRSLGLVVQSEDGYIYPVSNQALSVVKALHDECLRYGVSFKMKEQLKEVKKENDGSFIVRTDKGVYDSDRFIMAIGGMSGPKTTASTGDGYYICKKLGISIKECFPALVGLKTDSQFMPQDSGVRAKVNVSFMIGNEIIATEYGEVQFTKDTISGFPIMQQSGEMAKHLADGTPITCCIDFFPEYDENSFELLKREMLRLRDNRSLEQFLSGFGNSNINDMIIKRMKFGKNMKMKNISEKMARDIMDMYRSYKLEIIEPAGYQSSQVTKGGVSLGEVNDDLEVKKVPGMFIIGELLDVDGRCGGYNLQWAWTSAFIAAQKASI
ncbi:MAG: aminoacetone oxidase family FAD-binding enzyme [Butyrivibrio sp.]|nr:aminoacetone oxidase family FAD-binding enzyme [Butyrivibrio sp.]